MLNQNDLEHIQDLLERGEITASQANVEIVKSARFKVVTNRLPKDVRKALNDAVNSGELCHKKKNGMKPEIYYHPSFEHLANQELNRIERDTINSLVKVCI